MNIPLIVRSTVCVDCLSQSPGCDGVTPLFYVVAKVFTLNALSWLGDIQTGWASLRKKKEWLKSWKVYCQWLFGQCQTANQLDTWQTCSVRILGFWPHPLTTNSTKLLSLMGFSVAVGTNSQTEKSWNISSPKQDQVRRFDRYVLGPHIEPQTATDAASSDCVWMVKM